MEVVLAVSLARWKFDGDAVVSRLIMMRLFVSSYSARWSSNAHLSHLLGVWTRVQVFIVLPKLLVDLFTRQVLHADVLVFVELR